MVPRGLIGLGWSRSNAAIGEMKGDRGDRMMARRLSPKGRKGVLRCAIQSGNAVEPFFLWSSCTELLETFADTVGERPVGGACDEGVASMVSGLLEGTGCAVLKGTPPDERFVVVAATGAWEGKSLSNALAEAGLAWASALEDAPMVVVRRHGGVRLRPVRRFPRASAVAFPLLCGGSSVGGILVTYESHRGYGPSYLAAGKLLAGGLSMRLASERFEERTRQQGERISRLACDVERMGNLLRSASSQGSKAAS